MSTPDDLMGELKTWLLREPRWMVAAAESLTSGRVQGLLGSISGASEFFCGGITAYSLEQKVKLLGVNRKTAESADSVSETVAKEMAIGAIQAFGADWAVATTGYAETAPERGVMIPFAWWAVARHHAQDLAVTTGRVECPGLDRIQAQQHIAEVVLGELLARVRAARS